MIHSIYLICAICIIGAYVALIIYILKHWTTSNSKIDNSLSPKFSYSILIPARNEEKNIPHCINSILSNKKLNQFNFEIIVIDDHSTDNTMEAVLKFEHPNIIILQLKDYLKGRQTNSYKKEAINYALENAQGDYIIQTDADCTFNSNYLITLDKILREKQCDFAACPIVLHPAGNLLEHFQVLDMTGMMALTNAGISSEKWYMANGANMVYKNNLGKLKELSLASGDDIHRIESLANIPGKKVVFLNDENLIVRTQPLSDLSAFISQRLRWGTKNKHIKNRAMRYISITVYANALLLCIHPFLILSLGPLALVIFITHVLVKMSIDYIYLRELSEFFNSKTSLKYFFPSSIISILYIVIVGSLSLFVKQYRWKGRSVH